MSPKKHQRPEERKALKAEFMRRASVLLLAPRRVGKTWLMGAVKGDMAEAGWLCISIDLQGKDSEEEFLRELCGKVEVTRGLRDRAMAHLESRFKQVLSGASVGNLGDVVGKIDHRELLEALVKLLNDQGQPSLILIDELALFFQSLAKRDPQRAQSLLYHLRGLREAYGNVRWFLTGSVGLDAVSRRHGLEGAILGLEPMPLEPFTAEEANSFVDEVFLRVPALTRFRFAPGALEHFIEELGWLSPYHIEQLLKLIKPVGTPPIAEIEQVDAALGEILSPMRRLHFSPWEEHVKKNFEPNESQLMCRILDILCDHTDGEMEVSILTNIIPGGSTLPTRRQVKNALTALEVDAYLTRDGDRWKFRSGLLRRYWKEYCQE